MLRLAILCLAPFVLVAQDASLTLAGNVVDSQSGGPVAHALVSIRRFPKPEDFSRETPQQQISRSALTDAGGTFRFSALPAGNYSVSAQKPGYELSAAPSSHLGTGLVDLQSSVEDVRLALSPPGVITGKVVDDHDEPMPGVSIDVISPQIVDGLRQNRRVRIVNTDDCGEYRISDLTPGKYYLRATGQGGSNLLSATNTPRLDVGDSFAPVYFGGGRTVSAANPIEIGSGAQAKADFRLKIEPAWVIRATLRNFNPRENVTFALVIDGKEVTVGPDRANPETGVMEFSDVVSGAYVLQATQGDKTGEVAVNVAGSDTDNAVLALYPAVDIPVTVRFTNPDAPAPKRTLADDSDDDTPPRPRTVFLSPEQMNGSARAVPAVVMQQGVLHGVVSGKQQISIGCVNAYVRSALAGTQDLLANPVMTISPGSSQPSIDILATHGGGTTKVKVDSNLLSGPTHMQVLLVPQFSGTTGPDHLEGEMAEPNPTGTAFTFEFVNLAPGAYAVYAFGSQKNEYRNPEFLKSLSGGQIVQVDDGAEKEITINKVLP